MATEEFRPEFLSEEESRILASRRMLSFLTPPPRKSKAHVLAKQRRAPSKSLFSLGALPEDAMGERPEIFNWTSRDIYDFVGRLVFRDLTIDLGSGNEWRVRTAASEWLRSPVWSLKAGRTLNVKSLMKKALVQIKSKPDLKPLIVEGEESVRLVCYSYPKLGILLVSRTDPGARFIIDIGNLNIIPVAASAREDSLESIKAVWSPYDIVGRSNIAKFRSLWKQNVSSLPKLPKTAMGLSKAIAVANRLVKAEVTTNPEITLVPQQTETFCACATAKMILKHHGISKSQDAIAEAMGTGPDGTLPENQVNAIPYLSDYMLLAEADPTTSFGEATDEICQNRPFKTGNIIHARACGGFKVEEGEQGDQNSLYIYDPWPAGQGCIYYETWEVSHHVDYMYVRPALFS